MKAELGEMPAGMVSIPSASPSIIDQRNQGLLSSADLFTQDMFAYYANGNQDMSQLANYLDVATTALEANVSLDRRRPGGQQCPVNGQGVTLRWRWRWIRMMDKLCWTM